MEREAGPFFRDVLDHLNQAAEVVDSLDSLLSTAFDAHLARITVQQNDDMRKISAGVALVVVPTLIAGVYGMNFDHMPELGWELGYPFALALMCGRRRGAVGAVQEVRLAVAGHAACRSTVREHQVRAEHACRSSSTSSSTPRPTRYGTNHATVWWATNRSSQAIEA